MTETRQPNQEQARQIVRGWLTAQNRSQRNLAQEAGLPPSVLSRFLNGTTSLDLSSALKLYSIMQESMDVLARKGFIEAMGLLPLIAAFRRDTLLTVDLKASPYEVGSRLLVSGLDLAYQTAYEAAIPLFRMAATVLGTGSSQAAFAGCMIAQMFINLGDFQQAQIEANSVQATYGAVMDPATKAELYRIRNWLDYYQGNYAQAEQWLRDRITIGEGGGSEWLQNPHFLGRIYYDLGCLTSAPKASPLFHQAALCFEQSYQIDLRWGDECNQAFDLFRKAQVLHMQGQWQDAKSLRTQARQMFQPGSLGGLLHVELEEAKLHLVEGNITMAQGKIAEVLTGWIHLKYPKGIGDALKILGECAYMQGDLARALEIFTARLCIYPYENHPSTRQVWEEVDNLHREIIRREGRKFHQAILQQICTLADERQEYFAYLNQIVADRRADIVHVISRLQSPLP